ncbi:MAG: deoxyribonuclease IV [Melioribacter sp.]|nr:deoxyribonuclease IV [Melioribacter sp.]
MKHLLGAHVFLTNGPSSAIDVAEKLGFTAIQIFTKNNNQYFAKDLTADEINNFKNKLQNSNVKFVVTHDSYLINLCAKDSDGLKKSRAAFIKELERCEQLGIPHLNFHPGAHGGIGEEDGLKLIAESLNYIHDKTKGYKVKSMIETTAGQGTALGYKFEQIRKIIDMVEDKDRISVCIDTCHIFAAGYNIKDPKEYKSVIKEFDEIIGLDRLQCIHMNDSKKELGSRIDRHEHIGKGFIGLEGFANIMNDKKLERVPKILETPKEKDQKEDLENIKILISLIKK